MLNQGYAMLDRRREAILKRMAKVGPFMMASPQYVKVECGNPRCKCTGRKKDRHKKLHLVWMDAQGSGTQYVPVDLREEVLEWVENYWRMKEYMKEMTKISHQMIKIYAKTLGRVKRKQGQKAKR